jgi:hypothetical protein
MLVAQEPTQVGAWPDLRFAFDPQDLHWKAPAERCPLLEQGRRTTMQPSDGQLDRLRNRQREKKRLVAREQILEPAGCSLSI